MTPLTDEELNNDLTTIIQRWPGLPVHVKSAIMALIAIPKKRKAIPKVTQKGPYNAVPIWCDVYKSWHHITPTISGPDGKWLKELARWYPENQLKAMMNEYFKKRNNLTSAWLFYSQRNELAAVCQVVNKDQRDEDEILEEMETEI